MRTTDLALFAANASTLDPASFAPQGVRGPNKVAQRVLYALLTPSGSVPGRPNDGCGFLSLIGNFSSEFDLFTAFAAAEPGILATVKSAEDSDDLDAERIGAVRLSGIEVAGDGVTFTVSVATADPTQAIQDVDFTLQV